MFSQAPKELAPTEDQGVIFGIVDTPVELDARPAHAVHPRGEPDGRCRSRSRSSPSRSPSRTAASGASVLQAVGGARANGVRDPPGGAGRGRGDPRHPDVPDPAAGAARRRHSSRSSSSSPRPPRAPRSWSFAQKLQEKATASGMFAFPPLIDVKIDQPAVGDRDRSREGGRAGARPPDGRRRTSVGARAATTSTASASAAAATRSSRSSCAPSG